MIVAGVCREEDTSPRRVLAAAAHLAGGSVALIKGKIVLRQGLRRDRREPRTRCSCTTSSDGGGDVSIFEAGMNLLRGQDFGSDNLNQAGKGAADSLLRPRVPERSWLERSPLVVGLLPIWIAGSPGRRALDGGGLALAAPAPPGLHADRILEGWREADALLAGLAVACPEAWLGDLLLARRRAGLRPPPFLDGGLPAGLPGLEEGVAWALAQVAAATGEPRFRVEAPQPAPPASPVARLARALDEGRTAEAAAAAAEIAGRRAQAGSWLAGSGVADRLHPSAVTGLLALAAAFLRLDAALAHGTPGGTAASLSA